MSRAMSDSDASPSMRSGVDDDATKSDAPSVDASRSAANDAVSRTLYEYAYYRVRREGMAKESITRVSDDWCRSIVSHVGLELQFVGRRTTYDVPMFSLFDSPVEISLDAIIVSLVYFDDEYWENAHVKGQKVNLISRRTSYTNVRKNIKEYAWRNLVTDPLACYSFNRVDFFMGLNLFRDAFQPKLLEMNNYSDMHPFSAKMAMYASWRVKVIQPYFHLSHHLVDSMLGYRWENNMDKIGARTKTTNMPSITYYRLIRERFFDGVASSALLQELFYAEDFFHNANNPWDLERRCVIPLYINLLLWLSHHTNVKFDEAKFISDANTMRGFDDEWFMRLAWPFTTIQRPFSLGNEYGWRIKKNSRGTGETASTTGDEFQTPSCVLWKLLRNRDEDGLDTFLAETAVEIFKEPDLRAHWEHVLDIFDTENFREKWAKPLVDDGLVAKIRHTFNIATAREARDLAIACNIDIDDFEQRILMDHVGSRISVFISAKDEPRSWIVPPLESAKKTFSDSTPADEDVLLLAFIEDVCNANRLDYTFFDSLKYSPISSATRTINPLCGTLANWKPTPSIIFLLTVKMTLKRTEGGGENQNIRTRQTILALAEAARTYMKQTLTIEKLALPSQLLRVNTWQRIIGLRVRSINENSLTDSTYMCELAAQDGNSIRLPFATLIAAVLSRHTIPDKFHFDGDKYSAFVRLVQELLADDLKRYPHPTWQELVKHPSGLCWTTSYNMYKLAPSTIHPCAVNPDETLPFPKVLFEAQDDDNEPPDDGSDYFREDSWLQEATLIRLFMTDETSPTETTEMRCQQLRERLLLSTQLTSFPFICSDEIYFGQLCIAYLWLMQYRPKTITNIQEQIGALFRNTTFPQKAPFIAGSHGFMRQDKPELLDRGRAWSMFMSDPASVIDLVTADEIKTHPSVDFDKFKAFTFEWVGRVFDDTRRAQLGSCAPHDSLKSFYDEHPHMITISAVDLSSSQTETFVDILKDSRNMSTLVQWISIFRKFIEETENTTIALPYCTVERAEHVREWIVPRDVEREQRWDVFLRQVCQENSLNFTLVDHLRLSKDRTKFKKKLYGALPLLKLQDWKFFRPAPLEILVLLSRTYYQLNRDTTYNHERMVDVIVGLALCDLRVNDEENVLYRRMLFYDNADDNKLAVIEYRDGSIIVDGEKSHTGSDEECIPYGHQQLLSLFVTTRGMPEERFSQVKYMTAAQFDSAKRRFSKTTHLSVQFVRIPRNVAFAWTRMCRGRLWPDDKANKLPKAADGVSAYEQFIATMQSFVPHAKYVGRLRAMPNKVHDISSSDNYENLSEFAFPSQLGPPGHTEDWWADPWNCHEEDERLGRNGIMAVLAYIAKLDEGGKRLSVTYPDARRTIIAECRTMPKVYDATSIKPFVAKPLGPTLLYDIIERLSSIYVYIVNYGIKWNDAATAEQIVDLANFVCQVYQNSPSAISPTLLQLLSRVRGSAVTLRLFADQWLYIEPAVAANDPYNLLTLKTTSGQVLDYARSYRKLFFDILQGRANYFSLDPTLPNDVLLETLKKLPFIVDHISNGLCEAPIKLINMEPPMTRVEYTARFVTQQDIDERIQNKFLKTCKNNIQLVLENYPSNVRFPLEIGNLFKIRIENRQQLPRSVLALIQLVRERYPNDAVVMVYRQEPQPQRSIQYVYYDYEIIMDFYLQFQDITISVLDVNDFGTTLFTFVALLLNAWHCSNNDDRTMREWVDRANQIGQNAAIVKFLSVYMDNSRGLRAEIVENTEGAGQTRNAVRYRPLIRNVTTDVVIIYSIPDHFVRLTSFPTDVQWLQQKLGLPRKLVDDCVRRWNTERHSWLSLQLSPKSQKLSTWSGLHAMARDQTAERWLWFKRPDTDEALRNIDKQIFNDINRLLQKKIFPPGRWTKDWRPVGSRLTPVAVLNQYLAADRGIPNIGKVLIREIERIDRQDDRVSALRTALINLNDIVVRWHKITWQQGWYDLAYSTRDLPRPPSDEEAIIRRRNYERPLQSTEGYARVATIGMYLAIAAGIVYFLKRRSEDDHRDATTSSAKRPRRQ